MKNLKYKYQLIINTLMDIFDKYQNIYKKAMYFGTDSLLYNSEINMITCISESNEHYIIGLAKELGITKGAVSQIVKKLEKKGMITKFVDPGNRSRLFIELTPKGICAYNQNNESHRLMNSIFISVLKNLPDDKINMLLNILKEIKSKILTIPADYLFL